MPRPNITPHQRAVLNSIRHYLRYVDNGVSARAIGAPAAIAHLERKGYIRTENRPGPRGGKHIYVVEVL